MTMTNKWQELWENKKLSTEKPDLATLISMVGWKTLDGDLSEEQWLEFVEFVAEKLAISKTDRIFEIGCGPGGFLLPFYQKGNAITGLDYSESLIDICRQIMPNGDFHYGEANHLPYPDQSFDVIFSNSVCHYFPDHEYTKQVLGEISRCMKPGGRGAILDANDASKQDAFMQHRHDRFGGKEEYDRQNQSLPQLFYEKDWFINTGAQYDLIGYTEDQAIAWYRNTPYRFNYFFIKQ
jgi:SAM-dependent methyltransferase